MIKIYLLETPQNYDFAFLSIVGTWANVGLCPVCEQPQSRRVEPLLIEWEPGSDMVGDFSWSGGDYEMIVLPRVREYLKKAGFECGFGRVEPVPPTTPFSPRRHRRVAFPYVGPELHWVLPKKQIRLNQEQSGVTLETYCSACKQSRYSFKREGIVIDHSAWNGCKMFRIKQFEPSAATFITEAALAMLKSKRFTNIGYLEAGVIQ